MQSPPNLAAEVGFPKIKFVGLMASDTESFAHVIIYAYRCTHLGGCSMYNYKPLFARIAAADLANYAAIYRLPLPILAMLTRDSRDIKIGFRIRSCANFKLHSLAPSTTITLAATRALQGPPIASV
jgi:hypothetical protein